MQRVGAAEAHDVAAIEQPCAVISFLSLPPEQAPVSAGGNEEVPPQRIRASAKLACEPPVAWLRRRALHMGPNPDVDRRNGDRTHARMVKVGECLLERAWRRENAVVVDGDDDRAAGAAYGEVAGTDDPQGALV